MIRGELTKDASLWKVLSAASIENLLIAIRCKSYADPSERVKAANETLETRYQVRKLLCEAIHLVCASKTSLSVQDGNQQMLSERMDDDTDAVADKDINSLR